MFDSIMWQYLKEEPLRLRELLASDFSTQQKEILSQADCIYITAHGSSYNAALTIGPLFAETAGIRVYAYTPSAFRHHACTWTKEPAKTTLVLGISQTGTSRGILEALEYAREQGFSTACITNNPDAPIVRLSKTAFYLACGEEHSNAKTKGYSCTLLILLKMAMELALRKQHINTETKDLFQQHLLEEIGSLESVMDAALSWCSANHFADQFDHLYVLGSGLHAGTAMEGSLKLMETMCVPAMYSDLTEFSHGMHRSVKKTSRVILIRSSADRDQADVIFQWMLEHEVPVLVINTTERLDDPHVINLPEDSFGESVLSAAAVLQTISVFIPETNGFDPNRPANDDMTAAAKTRV